MRRGRKPKPTKLKLLMGNPGHRPLNEAEPQPALAIPAVPTHLAPAAQDEYRRMGMKLYQIGILTEIDDTALSMYADAYARWVDAKGKVDEKGTVIKTLAGNPIQNPYLAIANKAQEQMYKMLAVLGMTPSDRARLKVDKTTSDSPYAEFGNG